MKSIKKILLGISIILFGGVISCSSMNEDVLLFIGWGISLVGLVISLIGYGLTSDEKE